MDVGQESFDAGGENMTFILSAERVEVYGGKSERE
jgi:hypothetical protein